MPSDWHSVWNILGVVERMNEWMDEYPCLIVLSSNNQNLTGYVKGDGNDSVVCKML